MNLFDLPIEKHADKSNEWYTPYEYIEAARKVMGGIDLDPASCELANQTVKATHYYTKEDDGLEYPWHGRVWLNPPFGRKQARDQKGYLQSNREDFILKLLREHEQGRVTQAIFLSGAMTDAKWFQYFWHYPICFTDHKVRFIRPAAPNSNCQMWSMLFIYLGKNEQKFIDIFTEFGSVIPANTAIRRQIRKPVNLELWNA